MDKGAIKLSVEKSQPYSDWPIPVLIDTGLPESVEYPLDALPVCLQKAAREVERFTKVPVAAPATIGLSMAATAIGKKVSVCERIGLDHYPALFYALVADSGERKTPAFKLMMKVMEDYVIKATEIYEQESREVMASNGVIHAIIKKLRNTAKADGANLDKVIRDMKKVEAKLEPEPVHPRRHTTDATEQRLFQKMHERDGEFAVLSSEGRPVIDSIMGKYSGNGLTGDAIYLAGISGDEITRDRVGGDDGPEDRVIYKPCLNVCIMVQPDKYMEAARHPSLRSSGALARIWVVKLPSLVGHRFEEENEPVTEVSR